jgi:hypothetical protein
VATPQTGLLLASGGVQLEGDLCQSGNFLISPAVEAAPFSDADADLE